jgi:CubicO group peptidase (beta-lactamase class C family)
MMIHGEYIPKGNAQDRGYIQGLGWDVCGVGENLCLQRTGGGPGFGSAIRLYPQRGLGIVLTANSTTIDREAILDLVTSLDWEG